MIIVLRKNSISLVLVSKFYFYFLGTSYLEENLSSLFMSASSSCGSYHRRLHRSHVTSIDHSFGRKSEESSEEVSS